MSNAIAISRTLVSAGVERKAADAIAEVVVTHSDENHSTKADIAEVKGEIRLVAEQGKERSKLIMGLQVGLIIFLVADKFI